MTWEAAEPVFTLSGPAGTVLADTASATFDCLDAARHALNSGAAQLIAGALPFDVERSPVALMQLDEHCDILPDWSARELPAVRVAAEIPSPTEHRRRIEHTLAELTLPQPAVAKVVLARGLRLAADGPLDGRGVLGRLAAADPTGYAYLVDLGAAGGEYTGRALVGVSPELLVTRSGRRVTCLPFAGSAPRHTDPAADAASGEELVESAKNRHEHQLVVDQLRGALEPLCVQISVAARPQLSRTAAVWHLSTPISGYLRDLSTSALDLALALHPTAAVGGTPTASAVDIIRRLEEPRGFYAGAVGWCDARGDGRWVVAIRCAELAADRRTALARAGGGIVAGSDPDEELAETSAKFKTILSALQTDRIDPPPSASMPA